MQTRFNSSGTFSVDTADLVRHRTVSAGESPGGTSEQGNSRINSSSSGIRAEKVPAGLSRLRGRRMPAMSADVTAKSPGGTSPRSRVGRAGLRALRRARGIPAGFFPRRKLGKPRNPLFLTKEVPAGFRLEKKVEKPRNSLFFTKRVPVGLRPARTEAYGGAYMPYIGGIPLYAVSGSSQGTRSSFGCNPERNPGAIFSSRPSRAIPTGDPSERRMSSGNHVSDIES